MPSRARPGQKSYYTLRVEAHERLYGVVRTPKPKKRRKPRFNGQLRSQTHKIHVPKGAVFTKELAKFLGEHPRVICDWARRQGCLKEILIWGEYVTPVRFMSGDWARRCIQFMRAKQGEEQIKQADKAAKALEKAER